MCMIKIFIFFFSVLVQFNLKVWSLRSLYLGISSAEIMKEKDTKIPQESVMDKKDGNPQ